MSRNIARAFAILVLVVVVAQIVAQPAPKPLPDMYLARLSSWYKSYVAWTIAHFTIGVASTLLSVAVASYGDASLTRKKRAGLSFAAAACAALLTFVGPTAYAKAYHAAWRIGDSAVRRYNAGEISMKDLNIAIDEGEKLIGDAGPF